MTSLFTKSIVSSGLIVFSLALNGGAATAANLPVHKATATTHVSQPRRAVRVAARQPAGQPFFDIGQFFRGMFGGPLPPQYARIVQNAVRESASHRSSDSYESSAPYDVSPPSPTVDIDNSQSQAAIEASDQALQQLDQSLQDTDASNAAAQAQNDAANAATLQTEINAGM